MSESRSSAAPAVPAQAILDRTSSRAAGAPLVPGNRVRLLRDATAGAERYVHFESYIIRDGAAGRKFADARTERARGRRGAVLRSAPLANPFAWMGDPARSRHA